MRRRYDNRKDIAIVAWWKIFPIWLVPLANDEGGNLFAYSIRNGEEGAIYYYSHEFEYGENPEKYIKYLSKDIDAFKLFGFWRRGRIVVFI